MSVNGPISPKQCYYEMDYSFYSFYWLDSLKIRLDHNSTYYRSLSKNSDVKPRISHCDYQNLQYKTHPEFWPSHRRIFKTSLYYKTRLILETRRYTVHVIQAMLLPNSSDWMLKQRFYQGFKEQSLESVAIRFKIFALIQKRKIVGFVGTLEETDWTHEMRPPISPSRVTTGCPLQVLLREIDCVILTAILTVWYWLCDINCVILTV